MLLFVTQSIRLMVALSSVGLYFETNDFLNIRVLRNTGIFKKPLLKAFLALTNICFLPENIVHADKFFQMSCVNGCCVCGLDGCTKQKIINTLY